MTAAPVVHLPVGDLHPGHDHLPGLDRTHLTALLDGTRVDPRPLQVTATAPGLWRITNGRHRWTAALIRGDATVPTHIVQEPPR